jgi:hypothetical protein
VNRSLISWLSFCAVRFLCFFAYVLMTYVTYGMRKSLCKVAFDMYSGIENRLGHDQFVYSLMQFMVSPNTMHVQPP